MNFIEPTQKWWPSPISFVPKKDGNIHFCSDYSKLDAVTIPDSYPIPHMVECIDLLDEAKICSALNADSRYWRFEIAKQDRESTAFRSHHRLYRPNSMSFGLKNARKTFQRAMDDLLTKGKRQFALSM